MLQDFDLFDDKELSLDTPTDSDNFVDLSVVSVQQEIQQEISEKLEYPCYVLEGVTTKEELQFLKDRVTDADDAINFYIKFQGCCKLFGKMNITLANLLVLRRLGDYTLTVYDESGTLQRYALKDEKTLLDFIKI